LLAEQLNEDCPLQGFDWNHCRAPDCPDINRLFSSDPNRAEQFLRSAVVVALADGHLSQSELDLLQTWASALGLNSELINSLVPCSSRVIQPWKPLDPLKQWLDDLDPCDERISSFIVHLIPSQCPFERDIILFGRKLVHVPAMCKINPLYEQLVALRFRCLVHLSMDEQLRISCRESAQV
ncbi:TerB family tellurite resistance protein, partial [Synechococcus sp. AH-551-E11]